MLVTMEGSDHSSPKRARGSKIPGKKERERERERESVSCAEKTVWEKLCFLFEGLSVFSMAFKIALLSDCLGPPNAAELLSACVIPLSISEETSSI